MNDVSEDELYLKHQDEIERELEIFNSSLKGVVHPTSALLQTHLFIEKQLHKVIRESFPNGKKLIRDGNLSSYQKIVLVESLGMLTNQMFDYMKKLNSLRNDLAHELDFEITHDRIDNIGRTLGKSYSEELDKVDEPDLFYKIQLIMNHFVGYLITRVVLELNEKK